MQQDLGVLKGKASQKNERIQFSFKLESAEQTGFFPQQPVTTSLNAQFGIHLVVKWDATPLTRIISNC